MLSRCLTLKISKARNKQQQVDIAGVLWSSELVIPKQKLLLNK